MNAGQDALPSATITSSLNRWRTRGEPADEAFRALYCTLLDIARGALRGGYGYVADFAAESLVHEAILKIRVSPSASPWRNPMHFTAVVAQTIRQVMIDRVRRRQAVKRGAGASVDSDTLNLDRVPAHEFDPALAIAVREAIELLRRADPQLAKITELRFFAGFEMIEIARLMNLSVPTVQRRWRVARRLLRDSLAPAAARKCGGQAMTESSYVR